MPGLRVRQAAFRREPAVAAFSLFLRFVRLPFMNGPSLPATEKPRTLLVRGRLYEPAVGPRLKILLFVIFAATAVLGITGIYLVSIRLLEWWRAQTYTNQFTLWMFITHILVGLVIAVPFLAFGLIHYAKSRHRKNRLAVKLGLAVFACGIVVVVSGLALIQLEKLPQLPTGSVSRWVVWGLHFAAPILAVILYVLHRRAGPDINWKVGYVWGGGVAAFVAVVLVLQAQDPRKWGLVGPREGAKYFEPSKARTATGAFIPANALMMDTYCKKCHENIFNDHFHSAHKFSSFNNAPYRFSVRNTRKFGMERDGHPRASRWCAGCHDPVPFFSGAFDNPEFDDEKDATAHAGITCVVCHGITTINDTMGNGAYTIDEPEHYPWAYSDNPVLQWFNNQIIKAKPDFHKKTFLKPFHRGATLGSEFCSTCHKVSLPVELNHYKEFLRGQNHSDSYQLSGVSGHGARSFYYPPKAKTTCAECHMPLKASGDFGAKDFDNSGTRKVHDHLFPAANTGLTWLLSLEPKHAEHAAAFREAAQRHAEFLRGPEGAPNLRIDVFGLKAGGSVQARLVAPLRPELPRLKPGQTYLIEVVVRTLGVGHAFTQGTVDSNEVWVDFTARSGGKVIGRSGALSEPDESGALDEWAHRINVLMLDRNGNRVNRRNPEDIFTPLYDHQIPPGAGQVVHYRLEVPKDVAGPVELEAKVRYRKFDFEYMALVFGGEDKVPKLPIIDICSDRVELPVEGVAEKVPEQISPIKATWQRWNDYGIGLLLQRDMAGHKGELKQAEEVFTKLLSLGDKDAVPQGHVNRARVFIEEGRWNEAAQALDAAAKCTDPPAPWWTVAWLSGRASFETAGDAKALDEAIRKFEMVVDPANQDAARKFDFSKDYVVIGDLARALYQRAQMERNNPAARDPFLRKAIDEYNRVLALEPEDLDAHYGLHQCYRALGRAMPEVTLAEPETRTDEESLRSLSRTLRDAKEAKPQRLQAAARLAQALTELGNLKPDPTAPKRVRFDLMLAEVRPFFGVQEDPDLTAAAARVLDVLHREMHAILRPDDLAQNLATQKYRLAHPAADRAAEAIVIYPLNRKGAPGL
jgi:tetratricopeptide (TPR) repeat protein